MRYENESSERQAKKVVVSIDTTATINRYLCTFDLLFFTVTRPLVSNTIKT